MILSQLWPGLPAALVVPVIAYVACLATMAAQAAAWWLDAQRSALQREAGWAALGGLLFVCSDALLAADRFASPLPQAELWILGSYWLAQWCISCALRRPAGIWK